VSRISEADRLRGGAGAPVLRDPDVRDPIGSALFAYRDVAWDIQTAIDSVLIGLFGGSGSERDGRGGARAASSGEG
jgi:hypothetical protein